MDTESSTYGVQSLEEVISIADGLDPCSSASSPAPSAAATSPTRGIPRPSSVNTISLPLTPVYAQSPSLVGYGAEAVSPSRSTSLHSFQLEASDNDSDREEESTSQAIASGSDDDDEEVDATPMEGMQHQHNSLDDGNLQLVMPSVTMPQRRPFTERGRQLGKLKILLAGASGCGKSSLVKSIVQVCEDIVHVDPLKAVSPTIKAEGKTARTQGQHSTKATVGVTEVYASTKAYPTWWSEIEESKLLRRRRSFNNTVLERNICFVDTPGFDSSSPAAGGADAIVQHVERLLHRNASPTSMSDGELLNLLAGSGGVQVDLVLFCTSSKIPLLRTSSDIKLTEIHRKPHRHGH